MTSNDFFDFLEVAPATAATTIPAVADPWASAAPLRPVHAGPTLVPRPAPASIVLEPSGHGAPEMAELAADLMVASYTALCVQQPVMMAGLHQMVLDSGALEDAAAGPAPRRSGSSQAAAEMRELDDM